MSNDTKQNAIKSPVLQPRNYRKAVPSDFMFKVEPSELQLLHVNVKALFGNNCGLGDATRVEYQGDCVLTDMEESELKDLLIRINRSFMKTAGKKSGISEFWGSGNRGSQADWVYMADLQQGRTGSGRSLDPAPEGHIRIDIFHNNSFWRRGIVFHIGDLYAKAK